MCSRSWCPNLLWNEEEGHTQITYIRTRLEIQCEVISVSRPRPSPYSLLLKTSQRNAEMQ